jgi:RHS repeat-associated protein
MSSAQEPSQSMEYYYYTPDGKRFARQMANGDTQYMLYGAYGEALGTFSAQSNYSHTEMSVYFGGRRLWQGATYNSANGSQGAVFADRLGSNRYTGNYYPYGDSAGTAPPDQVGFATYTQDSYTGLDYANQRMFDSTNGRFNTADPYMASARGANNPNDPGSWNHYAYTGGDPVNRFDPTGQLWSLTCGGGFEDDGEGGGGICGGGFPGCGGYTISGVSPPCFYSPGLSRAGEEALRR